MNRKCIEIREEGMSFLVCFVYIICSKKEYRTIISIDSMSNVFLQIRKERYYNCSIE
jgi:hypothetical protein